MIKLLVVDDEADVCDFVKSFFKERNFEVFVASNGQEALHIVEHDRPQIVILDMRMPVMDGMAVLRELRRSNCTSKVIMVTAVEDTSKAEEAKKHGAVEYITKPLLLEQLERAVLTVAERIKLEICAAQGQKS